MSLSGRFTIRDEATPALLELLSRTTLGTNGARYRHLDTHTRICEADNPLFLSVERDGRVQGNVTFCKRGKQWYVRYFAFAIQKQACKNNQHSEKGNSILKKEISGFYEDVFEGKYGDAPDTFYAYIDARNERSKWMADQFGFRTEAHLMTQTFSRVRPRKVADVREIRDEVLIAKMLHTIEETHAYYVAAHAERPTFYGMYDADNELIAFAKITRANWVIERLPGWLGGALTKMLPYIPRLRRIVKPKNHQFLVLESVWVNDHHPRVTSTFFEGILEREKQHVLLWWVDRRESLWRDVRQHVNWGLLHGLTSQTPVDVVVLRRSVLQRDDLKTKPIFVAGWDMV